MSRGRDVAPGSAGLALVQRRILALPGEARTSSDRTSEQLKRLGVLLY